MLESTKKIESAVMEIASKVAENVDDKLKEKSVVLNGAPLSSKLEKSSPTLTVPAAFHSETPKSASSFSMTPSAFESNLNTADFDTTKRSLVEAYGSIVVPHQFLQISLMIEEIDASGSTRPVLAKKEPQFSKSMHDSKFKHDWTIKIAQGRKYHVVAKVKNAHPLARFTSIQVNNQTLSDYKKFVADNNALIRMEAIWITSPEACSLTSKGERTYVEVKLGYSMMDVEQIPINFKMQLKVYRPNVASKHLWGTTFDHATILVDTRSGLQEGGVEIFYVPGGGMKPKTLLGF